MKRKFFAAVMAMAMAATVFAGCGGSDSSSSSAAADSSAASASAASAADASEAASSEAEAASTASDSADASAASSASSASADDASATDEGWVLNMDDMLSGSPFEGLTAEGDYQYQLIVKSYSASFFQAVQLGAEAAASELGVSLDCNGPNTESDIADQVNMFNAAILNGMDGVAIAASDAKSVKDSLETAKEQGVPIVAFDSAIENAPEGSVMATVATDSPAAGKIGAQNVYDAVSYKVEQSDAPIRIGMVANDNTSRSNSERGLGFVDGIIEAAQADGYKVAVIGTEWFVSNCIDAGDENDADIIVECRVPSVAQVEQCAAEVSAVLNKADTVAVFGTNQTVTEGIIQANNNLNVLGTDPETSVLGTGFDAGAIIKDAVASGTLYGCVTQMPYAMGYYTIASMVANNNGQSVSDLPIPAYWYNASNMDDPLIAPNLYD